MPDNGARVSAVTAAIPAQIDDDAFCFCHLGEFLAESSDDFLVGEIIERYIGDFAFQHTKLAQWNIFRLHRPLNFTLILISGNLEPDQVAIGSPDLEAGLARLWAERTPAG